MKRLLWLALLTLASACATRHRHDYHQPWSAPAPPPPWTQSPKPNDSVNLYRVGHFLGQADAGGAREAAFQDALRQIDRAIRTAAGVGDGPVIPLGKAEIMPGCSYVRPAGSGFEAWVQVSFPLTEKNRLVESLGN